MPDTFRVEDLQILNVNTGNLYNYNPCVIGDRMFFRVGNEPRWLKDVIYTCLLDESWKYVEDSFKQLQLHSKFIDNTHVEDPRVILHKGYYMVCYTDGHHVGIAKLDLACNTVYTHYVDKPYEIKFRGSDGREKNWLPISMGDEIHLWYSDYPRTFLVYKDSGDHLSYDRCIQTDQSIESDFGGIRGGCAPIDFDENTKIWFFHTFFQSKYRIGAYLTQGLKIVSITPNPIITGNHIVFPCGATKGNECFHVWMGVNDRNIGVLKIPTEKLIFRAFSE